MANEIKDEFESEFGEDFEDFDVESEQSDLQNTNTYAPQPQNTGAGSHLKKLAGLGGVVFVVGIASLFLFKDSSTPEKTDTPTEAQSIQKPPEKLEKPTQSMETLIQNELQSDNNKPSPINSEQPEPEPTQLFEEDLFKEQTPSDPQATQAPKQPPTQTPTEQDTPKLFDTISGLKKELFGDDERSALQAEQDAFSVQQTQALQQALNVFSQKMQTNTEQIQTLEDTLTEVAKALNGVSKSVGEINSEVNDLSRTTNLLSKEYQNIKKVIHSEDLDINSDPIDGKPKSEPIKYTGPEYVVHAIIPGRAWLKSQDGEIVTVSEGDTLGNFGKILVIDSSNGVVMTASGIAFR